MYGNALKKFYKFYNSFVCEKAKSKPQYKIIKGNTANIGKANGAVKIMNDANDFYKFEKGDIIVTSMTTPNYITAMKKAAAIVIDEGGITCHVAIISREFGIPCIIGTKIATKVLKDGDMVEVDANRGIVKILNKRI